MDTNFNYSYDGITFSGVKRPGITMGGYPFGMKDNYEIDGENISKIKHLVFNAIDIDWNGAVLKKKKKTINTTSDLLNVIDKVEEVDVSGLAETFATKKELTQTEETISETISALNDTVDKKVDWVESVSGRNHIVLKNHDSILGTATDGQTYNVAMVSKWDVADFGTNKLHTNLNTSDAVTINDDKVIATTDQLDSMASGLLTTINSVVQAVSDKASTEYVDTKISDLIGAAPAELDTLKEIADRLATDNNALSGLFNVIGTKANSKDVFTKEEATSLMDEKDLVIASALNDLDSKKANVEDVYTKEEANNTFLTEIPEVDLSEYATLTYVDDKVEQIVGTAPENFDTLEELAEVVKDLPKVVDVESAEGIKYTQDEIDDAQEGDEAYGKTINDWKVEPVKEVSHPMTISEFVTTSMEAVNEKPQIEVLKTKYNALLSLLNITDADVNSVIVNKQLEGSNNVVYNDGYINNIETSASTTGTKTITANLGQENVEDLQMTTLTLGAPKSVTINNTGDHVVDLNVNAPATESSTPTPTVTIKDGDFDQIQLENASLTVSNDATVHSVVITGNNKKNVTINCIFVEEVDKDDEGNTIVHAPTITNNSSTNITLNNKNEEASDVVIVAPNSTVTLSGGKWETISGEVSENTLIIKGSAKIQSLNLTKGNVIVEVPREKDIHTVISGKITLGEGYTITHRQYDITNDNSSKLGGIGEMILQEDITRTSSIVAPLAPAYNAVWNLNGHNITVTGTPKSGVYLNRYTSNLEVKGTGTIRAEGTYGLWNTTTTGKIIVNDGVTVEAQTHAIYAEKGTIEINGGSFKLTNPEESEKDANGNFKFLLNCYDANYTNGTASIIVKGGKFYGFNPAESYGEPLKDGKVANFVAEGYESVPTNEAYEYGAVYEVRPISE